MYIYTYSIGLESASSVLIYIYVKVLPKSYGMRGPGLTVLDFSTHRHSDILNDIY
jgi:hypothetical protein